jgi:hypothetical protein
MTRTKRRVRLGMVAIVLLVMNHAPDTPPFRVIPGPVDLAQWSPPAYGCCTQFMRCQLPYPQPAGSPCVCMTPRGAMRGFAC